MFFDLPKEIREEIWVHVRNMREKERQKMVLNMEWHLYMWLYQVHLRIIDIGYERCGL